MEHVPSDADLMVRSVAEPEAFAVIFDRHFEAVHGYLSRRLGRSVAEDQVSEVLRVPFQKRSQFEPLHESARPTGSTHKTSGNWLWRSGVVL